VIGAFVSWYALSTLFGAAVWPLAYRMLPGLTDRGYSIIRPLGLLLVGYVFWVLGSLGLLNNSIGGIIFAMLIVVGLSIWAYITHAEGDAATLVRWTRDNWQTILSVELVFLLMFVAWAVVRAYSPEIRYTEKPMELAFLNGVRASDAFPPQDPWLSGYAISYYYFGYVIMAMLADLSGVSSGVAFNLAIALLFGLTAAGSYGLVLNLIASHRDAQSTPTRKGVHFASVLAPVLVLVVGNLMGLLDVIRSLNLQMPAGFWAWLDIPEITEALPRRIWPPTFSRGGGWWWWRASRVLHDRAPTGAEIQPQPIDEFPMFSFILGDMHPHVLILPFIMVALVLAFNALNQDEWLQREQLPLYIVSFGGLAFLNAWDFPIYGFVLIGALMLRGLWTEGSFSLNALKKPGLLTLIIVGLGIVAYLPWYVSFSSQAGGILPNPLAATPFQQFFVMFGPFIILIVLFVADTVISVRIKPDWILGIGIALAVLVTLLVLLVVISLVALNVESGIENWFLQNTGTTAISEGVRVAVLHRLSSPVTPLILTLTLGVSIAALLHLPVGEETIHHKREFSAGSAFVLLMIVTGVLLTLGPEFIYLRDNFGQRINTIFKFYYAAWILWALASAFAADVLVNRPNPISGTAFGILLLVLVASGLLYPIWGITNRTNNFAGSPTLDGLAFMEAEALEERRAIEWLSSNAPGDSIILEAVGGAYSDYGRISAATGLQTVMGWANHQRQWRGDLFDELAGGREQAVQEIYRTPNIERAEQLIDVYGIEYIVVGPRERDVNYSSPGGIEKFRRHFDPVFTDGSYTIYNTGQRIIERGGVP